MSADGKGGAGGQSHNQPLLEAALDYAAKGVPVFPCGPQKIPLTEHGFKNATTDESQIRTWWAEHPTANIGSPTGRVLVVDVDGPEGEATLRELERTHEPLPQTLEAKTGRGRHLYFVPNDKLIPNSVGKLYCFLDGVYKPDGSRYIKRRVKTLLENWKLTAKWSSARSEEVVEFIRVDARDLWGSPPLDVLNLTNGLLHIETGQLMPHSADHLSSVQLPISFDPSATCPVWDDFVEDVFPSDARDIAWQIPSWLMVPDTSLQKALLLLGEGSNGKSTFLAGLSAFLGFSNVAAVSLHRLESDKFSVARLVGKLANVCADLPSSHLAGTSVFKQLVGGDRVIGERKYADSFEFLPFARLVFSANHPPRSGDSTDGFFRRWLVVPFTRRFERGDEIRDMPARLAAPHELSGLLNKALQARREMQECGGLLESPSMHSAKEEFRNVTDPISVWLNDWTVEDPNAFVAKHELLAAYNRSCEAAGRPPETETGFGRALGRLRPNLKDGQRTVAGRKVVRVWLGLGFHEFEDEDA